MRWGTVRAEMVRSAVALAALAGLGAGAGLWVSLAVSSTAHPTARGGAAGHGLARTAAGPLTPLEPASARPSRVASPPTAPVRRAWVGVPVATVWDHPGTARPEDADAVGPRADVARWLAGLDYQQRLGLDDLLATQALLDQPVLVYGQAGGWDHVLVLGQTGSVYPFGIAGWVPSSQLTFKAPEDTTVQATVDVPVLDAGGLSLSYGTTLPVASWHPGSVEVVLPEGRFAVPASSVRTAPLVRSGPAVVAQAERFLGLPYLWAGTSSFGFDCSGLTYTVYRQFGLTLPRDAADQAKEGTPVDKAHLAPGDLVFFGFGGTVDHVGIYAGNGLMVDSPKTGAAIEVVPLWTPGRSPYYAGARRYV